MKTLLVKYLKIDESDDKIDKLKALIPCAFEVTKDYKSELARKERLLGKYLIITNLNCKEEDIYYNSLKKPYVKNNLYFNISHSKEYIVFVSSDSEIGIDIESIDEKNLRILDYAFNKKEIDYIKNGEGFNSIKDRFTYIWTIKESLFKASGIEEYIEPRNIDTFKRTISDNSINEKGIIENKINFKNKEYYVYSFKFNDYIISVASADKYDDIESVKIDLN